MLDVEDKNIINSLFNFTFCGNIFIQILKKKNKYQVSAKGFNVDVKGMLYFDKKHYYRKSYDDLQSAILDFNYMVYIVIIRFDFFKDHYFNSKEFQQFVH